MHNISEDIVNYNNCYPLKTAYSFFYIDVNEFNKAGLVRRKYFPGIKFFERVFGLVAAICSFFILNGFDKGYELNPFLLTLY